MAWASLASNQWVSRNDLQDAVTTGVFTLKPGQTIPAGDKWVTRSEIETWINATVSSGASNQWPQKSWITASTTTTTSTTTTSTTTTTTSVPSFTMEGDNNNTADVLNEIIGLTFYNGVTFLSTVDFDPVVAPGEFRFQTGITPTQPTVTRIDASVGGTNGLEYHIILRKNGVDIASDTPFTMSGSPMNVSITLTSTIAINDDDTITVIYYGQ